MFRINFMMERLTPSGLTGAFAAQYLADLKSVGVLRYGLRRAAYLLSECSSRHSSRRLCSGLSSQLWTLQQLRD